MISNAILICSSEAILIRITVFQFIHRWQLILHFRPMLLHSEFSWRASAFGVKQVMWSFWVLAGLSFGDHVAQYEHLYQKAVLLVKWLWSAYSWRNRSPLSLQHPSIPKRLSWHFASARQQIGSSISPATTTISINLIFLIWEECSWQNSSLKSSGLQTFGASMETASYFQQVLVGSDGALKPNGTNGFSLGSSLGEQVPFVCHLRL